MSIRLVTLGTAIIAAVTLTACSSSTGARKESSPPTKAALTAIVLKPTDLLALWKAAAHDTSTDDDAESSKAVLTCLGVKDTTDKKIDKVYSQDFADGDNHITSYAESMKSEADIATDVAQFSNPKAEACFENAIRSQLKKDLPADAQVGSLSVKVMPGSSGGPANVIGTVSCQFDLTVQGHTLTAYNDIVYVTGKLIEAEIGFTSIGTRISETTRTAAVTAMAGRAAKV